MSKLVLNIDQKKVLLRVYAAGECEYASISFITQAKTKVKPIFEEELERMRKLRNKEQELFNRPAKEAIYKVILNERQRKQVKKALKTGEINPDEWEWLPLQPGVKYLSPSEYLALLEDTLYD